MSWQNETGGNVATVATAGIATVGVAAEMVGVATTTTAAGVTAHRVLVCLRAPPRGQLWSNNQDSWPQLWRRQRRAEEWRQRTFSVGRLVNLLPLAFVLEHGPQRSGRDCRQKVSRAMAGSSGPEAFTLLLRLLITHFDGVVTEEGYTNLHTFGMCNGMPFLISIGSSAYLCRPLRGVSVFCLRGRMWCWRWFGWRRISNFRLSCLRCTLVRRQQTRGHTPRWMLCGGLLVTNMTPAVNGETFFFSPCFFDESVVMRPVGAPARRLWARLGPSAVPVAFVADGIEPSFNCHAHQ